MQDEVVSAQSSAALCMPLVVTAPFTHRFTLSSPPVHGNPLMPLLKAGWPLEYQLSFHRPSVSESDFAWDNFQDQVVIQTRLCKLVVRLEAVKTDRKTKNGDLFFPRQLPEVKAPSFKLFDLIERNQQLISSPSIAKEERRALVVSESFHGDKRKTEALAPLDSIVKARSVTDALPLISTSRPGSGSSVTTAKSSAVSTEVTNDREAKAVILKMRARNRHQPVSCNSGFGSETLQPFPESIRLDSSAQAELEHFHRLVCSAMEGVGRDAASGKNELEYYKQFLPEPSSSGVLPVTAASVAPAKPESPQLEPCSNSTRRMQSDASNASRTSKRPVKLPTLSNELPSENNQETSPSKISDDINHISTKKLSSTSNKPPKEGKAKKAATATATPVASRPLKHQPLSTNSRAKPPLLSAPRNTIKASLSKTRKAAEPEHGLSDFDDSEPEVDTAPLLPDDLGGMMSRDDDADMAVY